MGEGFFILKNRPAVSRPLAAKGRNAVCTAKCRQTWILSPESTILSSSGRKTNIFEKSIESRKKGEPYVFYDGPPTANGKPHIGHVLTRVIKDMIPRYRTMKGYHGAA